LLLGKEQYIVRELQIKIKRRPRDIEITCTYKTPRLESFSKNPCAHSAAKRPPLPEGAIATLQGDSIRMAPPSNDTHGRLSCFTNQTFTHTSCAP
jgi:hypothetical protein